MTLIKSISGIRGTIGGKPGENLTPIDIVECTTAFGLWILKNHKAAKVVIGRDGRISGAMVSSIVSQTLISLGIDVVDLGYSTTPTVEMAVVFESAAAGIVLTASHNPKQWNALKFLNHKGEFISKADGEELLSYIEAGKLEYKEVDHLGTYTTKDGSIQEHIQAILDLETVNAELVSSKNLKVVVDCINSTGAISIPPLLDALGVDYVLLNEEITGDFAHNPEPLPENLVDLCEAVVNEKADFGIAVDPDVDRLALVSDDGTLFGEEYTLVAVADYLLSKKAGNTVSNLSSTRALSDITAKYGGSYFASAVGEVNVVEMMKAKDAVIGGEGNGGVIYPGLHYGRDALVGIAFVLSLIAERSTSLSALRASYPDYYISKNKIQLDDSINLDEIFKALREKFKDERLNDIDGLKIDFEEGWVHLRKSNTEPIIRVYSESKSEKKSKDLAMQVIDIVKLMQNT